MRPFHRTSISSDDSPHGAVVSLAATALVLSKLLQAAANPASGWLLKDVFCF